MPDFKNAALERLISDVGLNEQSLEIIGRTLKLAEDKQRVKSVEMEYGIIDGTGPIHHPSIGTILWVKGDPLGVHISVKLKNDFDDLNGCRRYLTDHGLPGEKTFAYNQGSYQLNIGENLSVKINA